jgi:hypothetical protein
MASFTGDASHQIPGMAFEVTQSELEQADRYETDPAYRRVSTRLMSGREAWVYADARVTVEKP